MRGDSGAVAFDHAPVHAGVVIVLEIDERQLVEFGAADVSAHGIEHLVPAVARLEQIGRHAVGTVDRRLATCVELVTSLGEGFLVDLRKAEAERAALPRRRRLVEREPLRLRNSRPRIAVGGMQPAASKVQRKALTLGGERAAAEPCARFDQQAGHAGITQMPGCGNAGGAAANDHDFGVALCHAGGNA